ncbi:MAG: phosphatidylcholine/phosphatidylserine synthase [Hyphomicrobiaceae bacterium]|nr:MAG: phosphatidylcholine/phosphatidylserine synthase [Hyphomicrobiaceae bacterium]
MEERLEHHRRRRRSRLLSFSRGQIPARALVPNFFTLLGLCAGLTAIRMAIDGWYDWAIAAIVFAALLDGVDGRLARLLKAQSRFGAELDSLADFVNFGVAPAMLVFTWGLGNFRGLGWIAVLAFAIGMGLRLARFNSMLDVEKPKWQSNYFTGVPAPAGALVVLLPLYLERAHLLDMRMAPQLIALYTLAMAFLLVSTIPTFSGKLAGERIRREYVLPVFMGVGVVVGMLLTYPYLTLSGIVAGYLGLIPVSMRRYRWHEEQDRIAVAERPAEPTILPAIEAGHEAKPETRH